MMNHPALLPKHAGPAFAGSVPSRNPRRTQRAQILALTSAIAMMFMAAPVQAQTAAPTETAMVRLIRGLVQSGALTKDVGEALLAQAQTEAMAAQQAQRQIAAAPAGGLRPEPGDVRVP